MDLARTPIVRLLIGLCVLSLLLAPLVGRVPTGRGSDDALRLDPRSDANLILVASSPQLAKPTTAPEPETAPLALLPFIAFLAIALSRWSAMRSTPISGSRRQESDVSGWLYARVRVTELRI